MKQKNKSFQKNLKKLEKEQEEWKKFFKHTEQFLDYMEKQRGENILVLKNILISENIKFNENKTKEESIDKEQ